MTRAAVACALATLGFGLAGRPLEAQSTLLTVESPVAAFAGVLERSAFVFTARAEGTGRTTTASVPARPTTTTVRVRADDLTVLLPRGFKPLAGRLLTIVSPTAGELHVASDYMIFATLVASDTGTALRLVGRAAYVAADSARLSQRIADAQVFLHQRDVRIVHARSSLVVLGTVEAVSAALPDSIARKVRFERAAQWVEATVRIERSYSPGAAPPATVTVLFPGSSHRAYGGPRLVIGDRRLFLLRLSSTLPERMRFGLSVTGVYYIMEPLDALPPSDSTIVRGPP